MVRRSSYRLGRRLKASQKDRLDYITYLQSEGMPTRNGTVTPAELVVRMRASMGGGGELATTLAPIPHNLGADFAAGGAFRGNIFPPVTLQGHFAGGGLMRAKLDAVPKILTARFAGGGEMTAYTPPAVLMSVSMSGGGEMAADIAEAFDSDAATLIAAMTVAPSPERQNAINSYIGGLKSNGIWAELDQLYVMAAHDAQAARLNWKNPAQSLTVVGAPEFLVDAGYMSNTAKTAYLNAPVSFATSASWQDADACLFSKCLDIGRAHETCVAIGAGSSGSTTILGYNATQPNMSMRINATGNVSSAIYDTVEDFIAVQREDTTDIKGFFNGVHTSTTARAGGVSSADTVSICAWNGGGTRTNHNSIYPQAIAGWGAALSDAQHLALATLSDTYLDTIKADGDAALLIATMSPAPDADRQALIKNTVVALKDASLWDKLDVLYMHAAHSKQAGSLNWKTPATLGLNPTGTYTHTVDVGIARNGAVIPTDVDFVVDAADYVYSQNSGHIGAWMANGNTSPTAIVFQNTNGTNASSPFTALNLRSTNDATGFVNSGTAIIGPVVAEDTAGHWVISRTGATASALQHNGVELATSTGASAALTGGRLHLLRDVTFVGTQQITHVGGGLTGTEIATLYDILSNYLASL